MHMPVQKTQKEALADQPAPVIIQTTGCKMYRRKHKLPAGVPVPVEKRPFLMSPLHHHYQKKGIAEEKVVMRFIIIAILLAIFTLSTLKLR